MLSENIDKALNEHMNLEAYSAYLYLSMAAHFDSRDLTGFAHWMKVQAREELAHVMKLYDFIHERNGTVSLSAIPAPPSAWKSVTDVMESTLKHEEEISQHINRLVDLVMGERDHATSAFLQWFVAEQVEEEASVKLVLQRVRMVEDAPGGLFILDQEMAKRVPAPDSPQ
jgi:ferritin